MSSYPVFGAMSDGKSSARQMKMIRENRTKNEDFGVFDFVTRALTSLTMFFGYEKGSYRAHYCLFIEYQVCICECVNIAF